MIPPSKGEDFCDCAILGQKSFLIHEGKSSESCHLDTL